MQYKLITVSVLSLFALSAIANPIPQAEDPEGGPEEPVPDGLPGVGGDPTPPNADPALAAGDVLGAGEEVKGNWDMGHQNGPMYKPLSKGNDMIVHNMIGLTQAGKTPLWACVNNYDGKWGKQQCDVMTFDLGKDGIWHDSHSCYAANKDCMLAAISAGFGEVTCYSSHSIGFDNCRMGYKNTTPLPAAQVMNPKDNKNIK